MALNLSPATFHTFLHAGENTCGIDENNEFHIKVVVDSSLYEGGWITYDMMNAFNVWEEASNNKVHIYMPGESHPENVFVVTVIGTHADDNNDGEGEYAGLTNHISGQNYSQDLDWDEAIMKINLDEFSKWSDTLARSAYAKKVFIHEMGHVLRLDEVMLVSGFKVPHTVSVMHQGWAFTVPGSVNAVTSTFCVALPTALDIYSLNEKWGWN